MAPCGGAYPKGRRDRADILDPGAPAVFGFWMQSVRAPLVALAVLLGVAALGALGCERNPPAPPEQPCNCDVSRGGTPHHASGRTEIVR